MHVCLGTFTVEGGYSTTDRSIVFGEILDTTYIHTWCGTRGSANGRVLVNQRVAARGLDWSVYSSTCFCIPPVCCGCLLGVLSIAYVQDVRSIRSGRT